MVNTIINATKTANNEGGVGVAIVVCLILCGIVFWTSLWSSCYCNGALERMYLRHFYFSS